MRKRWLSRGESVTAHNGMTVRLFGGWEFDAADLARPDWVVRPYTSPIWYLP